jgi:transcriptional antiterminator RfaH
MSIGNEQVEIVSTVASNFAWYVVQTKPHQEERASANLGGFGIQTFLPRIQAKRRARAGSTAEPLFPRYVFVNCDAVALAHKITYTRGVSKLLGNKNGPIAVEESIVDLVRNRVGTDGLVRLTPTFHAGDSVRVASGPFKDFIGIFTSDLGPADRVAILIRTVSTSVRVIVKREDLEVVESGWGAHSS